MRFVTAAEIRQCLDMSGLMDAFAAAHRHPQPKTQDVLLGTTDDFYFVRSAYGRGRYSGSKLVTSISANSELRGLPAVQAVFVLFDGETGSPMAVLDGTEITYWKTAADSGLGARMLAREDARTLLMVGAGGMAPWLIRAHLAARPSITTIIIWNRSPARAIELCRQLGHQGITASVVEDLAMAAASADIVSCATRADGPFFKGDWLKPGAHLDLVGGFSPATREADDGCFRRARVFTDSRRSAADVGDIIGPLASGALRPDGLLADLYELFAGAPGRTGPDDITLYKNAGGAHLDLMTAEAILAALA